MSTLGPRPVDCPPIDRTSITLGAPLGAIVSTALAAGIISAALLFGLDQYVEGTGYTIVPCDPRFGALFRVDRKTGEVWLVDWSAIPEKLLPDPRAEALERALRQSATRER